jgi:hypothetical protein
MLRTICVSLLAVAFGALQSGCCCCQLPVVNRGGPPIVFNAPPPPDNPPPDNAPPDNPPPDNPPPANAKPIFIKYQYNQNTGELKRGGQVIGTGFSGTGEAKNDPRSYKERTNGVIPTGDWRVERRRVDPKTGEPILDLAHFTGGHVAGRIPGENFTIHADDSPNAGESGIAMPRNVRDAIQIPKGLLDLAIIEVRQDNTAPPRPKIYTYSQSTGQLKFYSEVRGMGYSGKDKGKNNPDMQDVKDVGPVPVGEYEIISRVADPRSVGFKVKLKPLGKVTDRWPAEDIWIAPESKPRGNQPAIYIVFARQVVDRIEYDEKPRPRLKVVP